MLGTPHLSMGTMSTLFRLCTCCVSNCRLCLFAGVPFVSRFKLPRIKTSSLIACRASQKGKKWLIEEAGKPRYNVNLWRIYDTKSVIWRIGSPVQSWLTFSLCLYHTWLFVSISLLCQFERFDSRLGELETGFGLRWHNQDAIVRSYVCSKICWCVIR